MKTLPSPTPGRAGAFLVLCLLASTGLLFAQVSTRVSEISPAEAVAGQPVTITVTLAQTAGVQSAAIVYRPFGESDFRRADMEIRGTTATVTLPGTVIQAPSLEYYLVFALTGDGFETYPLSETADPFTTPPQRMLRLTVQSPEESQVIFLSPDPGEPIRSEDALISFSLLRADSSVDRRATKVQLDNADITSAVVLSDELGVVSPDNLGIALLPGEHKVTVTLFDHTGNPYRTSTMTFAVAGTRLAAVTSAGGVTYVGSAALESRHEDVASEGKWYNRATLNLGARYGDFRVSTNAFITSDERGTLQPQNRFFIGAESPWARIGFGDQTPTFPDLILSGKRVRGLHAAVTLGFFNVAVSTGQTTRPIEGSLLMTIPDSLIAAERTNDPGASYYQTSPGTWGKFSVGTYARDIFVIRPSFGSGNTWQLGFTWMKSKDDVGSINTGIRPQENAVVGADFVTRFDDRRIELSAQGAFSAYNNDISQGNISDERIAELFPNDQNTIKQARDILSPFITVNENLRPLSVKRLSTAAGEAALQLRYFQNALKFTYLYRGSDYTSFGQSFLRKDVAGFNMNDRVRLLENMLVLTGGYERLHDNTSLTKVATTIYSTANIAATYAPRENLPSVTVGYSRYDNDNGISKLSPDSLSAVSDVTNRIFVQSSYNFTYGAMHTASLNISSSDRSDATVRALDVSSVSVGMSLATRYAMQLTTSFDLTMNYNRLPPSVRYGEARRLDYTSIAMQARYELIPGVFSTQGALSPTFGDFKRTAFQLEGEWTINGSMRLSGEFSYFVNNGVPNENFLSVRYRYEL